MNEGDISQMNTAKRTFHKDILKLNPKAACEQIIARLRQDVRRVLQRRGVIIGLSGGVDSSVTLALAVQALTPERVLGVMMPERDSSPESEELARQVANQFGVETVVESLTDALEGFGCFRRRDDAIARVFPEYSPQTHRIKIGLQHDILNQDTPPLFSVTIIDTEGTQKSQRLPLNEYLEIVAASNFKQRSRMSMLYYHAEARHSAVVGTANWHEVEQGFFVKHGDGGVDVMPIGHLYKTQVYQLGRYLGVPNEILQRVPTSDTYSAEQTQEEFFFQLPFELLDLLWYAQEEGYAPSEVAEVLGLTEAQVLRVFANFTRKRQTTEYLRTPPLDDYTVA
jgi:NAD+ synthase